MTSLLPSLPSLPSLSCLPAVPAVSALLELVRRRPILLAAFGAALACYPNHTSDVSASYHVTPTDLGMVLFVAVAAWTALRDRSVRLPARTAAAFGLLATTFAVAALTSGDVTAGLSGYVRYVELFCVLPAAIAISLRDRLDVAVLVGALFAVAVVQGLIGTDQALTGTGASVAGQNVRAVGTFGALDITGMATVVAYGIVIAFGYGLAAPRGWRKSAALLLAGFLLVPLAFSQSRGAWIATAAALLAMTLVHNPWLAARAAVLIGVVLLAVSGMGSGASSADSGGAGLSSRLSSLDAAIGLGSGGADQSVRDRYGLWHAAESIWQEHPLFGVGLKEFPLYRDAHAPMDLSAYSGADDPHLGYVREPLLTPHNMYLLILSEQGLLGMLAFGVLAVVVVAGVGRGMAARPQGARRAVGLAAIGFLVWQGIDFLYADLGGVTSLVIAVFLGVAVWWAGQSSVAWSWPGEPGTGES